MTTMAMGAGMLPIAIGIGTDPSFRAPMAIVVIGGLITSTFLSLLVVPVVFTYVDDMAGSGSSTGGSGSPTSRQASSMKRWFFNAALVVARVLSMWPAPGSM